MCSTPIEPLSPWSTSNNEFALHSNDVFANNDVFFNNNPEIKLSPVAAGLKMPMITPPTPTTPSAAIRPLVQDEDDLFRSLFRTSTTMGGGCGGGGGSNCSSICSGDCDSLFLLDGSNPRYKTEMCRNFKEKARCVYGDQCQFAHGRRELREVVRNSKYKTKHCQKYWVTGYCAYGPRCNFLHNEMTPEEEQQLLMRRKMMRSTGSTSSTIGQFNCPITTSSRCSSSSSESSLIDQPLTPAAATAECPPKKFKIEPLMKGFENNDEGSEDIFSGMDRWTNKIMEADERQNGQEIEP